MLLPELRDDNDIRRGQSKLHPITQLALHHRMSSLNQASKATALGRSGSDLSIIPDSEPEPELLGKPLRPPKTTTKKRAMEIIELSDSDESLGFEIDPGLIVLSGPSCLWTKLWS